MGTSLPVGHGRADRALAPHFLSPPSAMPNNASVGHLIGGTWMHLDALGREMHLDERCLAPVSTSLSANGPGVGASHPPPQTEMAPVARARGGGPSSPTPSQQKQRAPARHSNSTSSSSSSGRERGQGRSALEPHPLSRRGDRSVGGVGAAELVLRRRRSLWSIGADDGERRRLISARLSEPASPPSKQAPVDPSSFPPSPPQLPFPSSSALDDSDFPLSSCATSRPRLPSRALIEQPRPGPPPHCARRGRERRRRRRRRGRRRTSRRRSRDR